MIINQIENTIQGNHVCHISSRIIVISSCGIYSTIYGRKLSRKNASVGYIILAINTDDFTER